MILRSFLLADSIAVLADGKAMISGAGVGKVYGSEFPWTLQQLAAYVTLEADSETSGSTHTASIDLVDADGAPTGTSLGGPFQIPSPDTPDAPLLITLAPTFGGVVFERPGLYSVRVRVDDEILGQWPLHVVRVSEGSPQWQMIGPPGHGAPPAEGSAGH